LASVLKLSVFASPLSRAVFSHFGASIARILSFKDRLRGSSCDKGTGRIKPRRPTRILSRPTPRQMAEAVRLSSTQLHRKPAGPASVFPSHLNRILFAMLVNRATRRCV
jgi:hypothetical protein